LAQDAEVACLRWDFDVGAWDSIHLNIPVALCNQAIYSPARQRAGGPRWDAITSARPLRCVLCDARPDEEPAVAAWLESMQTRFALQGSQSILVKVDERGARRGEERYLVFEFVPKRLARPAPSLAAGEQRGDGGPPRKR
jgi:hypothetical protein